MIQLIFAFVLLSQGFIAAMKRSATYADIVDDVEQSLKRVCLEPVDHMAVEKIKLSLKGFVEALMNDDLSVLEESLQLEEGINNMIPFLECFDVMSPLMIASFAGSVNVCEYLFTQGADTLMKSGNRDMNAIQIAYFHNQIPVLDFYLSVGLDVKFHLPDLLIKEVLKGAKADLHFLRKLLAGLDFSLMPDNTCRFLFIHALSHEYIPEMVSILVKLLSRVDKHHQTNRRILLETLQWIQRNGYKTREFVLNSVLSPLCALFTPVISTKNQDGESLLYFCASESMMECCHVLVDNGAFEEFIDPEKIDILRGKNALSILPRPISVGLYDSMLAYKTKSRLFQFSLGKYDPNSEISCLCNELVGVIGGLVMELGHADDGAYNPRFGTFDAFKSTFLSRFVPRDIAEYIVDLQYAE